MADLNPQTLRAIARLAEQEAQQTYDQRDSGPAADESSWHRRDGAAYALTNFGAKVLRMAKATEARSRRRRNGK